MEDNQIVDLYFARDEQAVVETDKKYGKYCFSLANRIVMNVSDAEEIVSDTYFKTWSAIPPRRPNRFRMFLAKITRNFAFNRWRDQSADKRGGGEMPLILDELNDCIPDQHAIDESIRAKELGRAIQLFLETLPLRDQELFLRRYFFVEEIGIIAEHYSMKQETVRKILYRTRCRLYDYLKKEGYTV